METGDVQREIKDAILLLKEAADKGKINGTICPREDIYGWRKYQIEMDMKNWYPLS